MELKELKEQIESSNFFDDSLIFICPDNTFLAMQYIKRISFDRGALLTFIDSLDYLEDSLFNEHGTNVGINVLIKDEVDYIPDAALFEKNLFIVCKSIKSTELLTKFSSMIITMPKLEEWMIKDYVYSIAEGVDKSQLDWLIEASKYDIYRLEEELDKLRIFGVSERKYLFNELIYEGAFSDISSQTIFNLTNAIMSKDLDTVRLCLSEVDSIGIEPLGVVAILYKNFRKYIQVWLARNPTPESTLLPRGTIYAISKQPRVYNKYQLIKSFEFLTNIDSELKLGNIDTKWLLDYVICKLLTF